MSLQKGSFDLRTLNKRLGSVSGYLFALGTLLAASLLTLAVRGTPLRILAGYAFLLAILTSAWRGGYGAGIFATLATALAAPLLVNPKFTISKVSLGQLLLLVLMSVLISRVAAVTKAVRAKLNRTNEWLEQQVSARTSELEESRKELQRAKDLLETTLHSIADAVIVTDVHGCVTFCNAAAQSILRIQASPAGKPLSEAFAVEREDTHERVESPIQEVVSRQRVVSEHLLLATADHRTLPVETTWAPIRDQERCTGVVLVFRDIGARREAERAAQRLIAIVESTKDAIAGETVDGVITTWNPGAARLFGFSAEEMIGGSVAPLIPADCAAANRDVVERVRKGESINQLETERLTKDGRRIVVSLSMAPIRGADGRIEGISRIARDITRERRLEEMIRQTQKLEAIGRLASGIAHDFNNLLTVILGYAAILTGKGGLADHLHKAVGEIRRAAEHASSLTGQLLAFTRKQVIVRRPMDLAALVVSLEDMIQRLVGEDIVVRVMQSDRPCLASADSNQLTQVLLNLAANARDAMPTGGILTVETRILSREQEDAGRRGLRPAGRYTSITVTDTGSGMDPETQAHLFEPFFTTKGHGKGTGLGLSTVYGIVQQHGGWVDFYSELGHGSAFTVYLPSAETEKVEDVVAPQPAAKRQPATVLIVEDQAAIRLLAEDVLSDAGYEVLSAPGGSACLQLAEKHQSTIDLLVTDVVLPDLSGPEIAARLEQSRPGILVLYMSGYTDHALLHRGAIEQGTAFLQKPFVPDALLSAVDALLRSRAPSSFTMYAR